MTQFSNDDTGETRYEIRVKGHLDESWSDWLDGWVVARLDSGETRLTGDVIDQSALHGILRRLRDLRLIIISVQTLGDRS
ncbi:MAG: hypothetical protein KJ065_12605 [Anaerolineae bacterium]|nr:hypothetical protein [Anaerolineae bacterium]